ncbi:MAG: hypothetical protein ACFFD4_07270 [Candidatus Odinarchaeota archaeon]
MSGTDILNNKNKDNWLYNILDHYWGDIFIIGWGVVIFLLYFLDGLIRGDFFHLDNYYIGLFFYQLILGIGLVLTFTRFRLPVSKAALYAVTLILALFYIFFSEGLFGGDITLGVIDGARTLFYGGNPYDPNNPCCTHGLDQYQHLAPYPYLPVDAVFHGITLGALHIISGMIFGDQIPWFAPSFNIAGIITVNGSLMILSMFVAYKTFPKASSESFMVGFLVIAPFLWNNVTLSTFLVICGLYFFLHKQPVHLQIKSSQINIPSSALSIGFFSLAGLSKYLAAIFIAAILVDFLRNREWKNLIYGTLGPGVIATVMMLPFNIFWVLDATVFFYSSDRRLEDLSMGGTIVSEVAKLLGIVEWVGLLSVVGFVAVGLFALFIRDSKTRLLFVGFASLNVITGFSAQFIPMMFYMLIAFDRVLILDQQKDEYKQMKKENKEQ